jgi:hypothetical protein
MGASPDLPDKHADNCEVLLRWVEGAEGTALRAVLPRALIEDLLCPYVRRVFSLVSLVQQT